MDVELIAPPVGKMANKRRTRKSSRNIRDIIVLHLLAECDGDWEGAEDRKKKFRFAVYRLLEEETERLTGVKFLGSQNFIVFCLILQHHGECRVDGTVFISSLSRDAIHL